jgi:hypothetical protein
MRGLNGKLQDLFPGSQLIGNTIHSMLIDRALSGSIRIERLDHE